MVITTSIVSFTFTSWLSVKSFSFFPCICYSGFVIYISMESWFLSVFELSLSFRVGLFSCFKHPRFGQWDLFQAGAWNVFICSIIPGHFQTFWHSRCSNDLLCLIAQPWDYVLRANELWFLLLENDTKNKIWVLESEVCSLLLRWHCSE